MLLVLLGLLVIGGRGVFWNLLAIRQKRSNTVATLMLYQQKAEFLCIKKAS